MRFSVDDRGPRYVDTLQLVRLSQEVQGRVPLAEFGRLLEGLPAQKAEGLPAQPDAFVSWQLAGSTDSLGQAFLRLRVQATVWLECQRCLAPFAWPVDADTRLQVVRSEAELDAEDNASDEADIIERIVASPRLDVHELVEDELILALPYVPKHDVCPAQDPHLASDGAAAQGRPSPFSVLGKLKKD